MTNSEYREVVDFLGRQFAAVDQRFAAMDRRFDVLEERADARFRETLGHFDEIYRRLERLEQEYQAIVQALRRIEGLLADEQGRREMLERGVAELKGQVAALQARIDRLEQELHE
ncbi:MAG: hypothetical protein HY727_01140 [Candidatus Rokubacteria bacterium]|nr:hypothetical protein [Candidatus Rokubacteria bacterium]